jgi:hypothetical protein
MAIISWDVVIGIFWDSEHGAWRLGPGAADLVIGIWYYWLLGFVWSLVVLGFGI